MNSLDLIADELLVAQVFRHYLERLLHTPRALNYLKLQDIDPELMIERRLCGFSDRTLGYELPASNSPKGHLVRGQLQRIGLLKSSGHELMRGALVFPLTNSEGVICQMYGKRITPRLRVGTSYELAWQIAGDAWFNRQGLLQANHHECLNPLEAAAELSAGNDGAVASLVGCKANVFGRGNRV